MMRLQKARGEWKGEEEQVSKSHKIKNIWGNPGSARSENWKDRRRYFYERKLTLSTNKQLHN